MQIAIVGTGYVGLVTGACLAQMGHHVTCLDLDADRLCKLRAGQAPFFEPGLDDLLQTRKMGFLEATPDNYRKLTEWNVQIIFICVGTPSDTNGEADLKAVHAVARSIGGAYAHREGRLIVVNKSTVPVGTAREVQKIIEDCLVSNKLKLSVVSNPEFLAEGTAIRDFTHPDRIVVGSRDSWAFEILRRLYEPLIRNGHPIFEMAPESAEIVKYAANTLLASRISFMNGIADLCEHVGGDILDVRNGVGSDRRIGMPFLYAGCGYGGSCFPKDVRALSSTLKKACTNSQFASWVAGIDQINEAQKYLFVKSIALDLVFRQRQTGIMVWGLAFKPNTDDTREAPAIQLIEVLLRDLKNNKIFVHDPVARLPKSLVNCAQQVEDPYKDLDQVDVIAICTEWPLYQQPNFDKIAKANPNMKIYDGRNAIDPEEALSHGITYRGIGRSS